MSLCDQLPTRTVAARKVTFPTAPVRSHPRSTVTEPRPRFVGLAWASLILGIVGVMCSAVPLLNAVTMLGAIVGLVLGGTGLFGFRKRLAAIGTVSCALAVVFTVSSPATVANQPAGPAPSMVAPRAPVEPPAALPAAPVLPASEASTAPAAPVSPTTAARRAVPTPPAEHVKTPSERAAVATPATAPQLVTPQPVVPRPVGPQPLATQPVVPQWDYDSSAGSVYYENCDAAWTAGAAPIKSGESGYRSELDRDHDGIACDK
ncbi:MAG TPA: excalibur calcium-binding domain-containing protein [Pseudonocardiaceae bacterium]|nr:excalibur calcium-binding domain-containing protein [Pseudonocardiaceae bacterium]